MKSLKRSVRTHPQGRRTAGRAQDSARHDPYQARSKPAEPVVCPGCGAVFHEGRWQWLSEPAGAERLTCPACQRMAVDDPAGIVTLAGPFVLSHRDEVGALVRHQEELEKTEHALNRIMMVRNLPDGLEITTTDIHLPRRIGEKMCDAYGGDLQVDYQEDRYFLRVRWSRQPQPE